MQLLPNPMKDKFAAGGTVFGCWITTMRSPAIVRIAAAGGADFVFIDMEHSSLSYETVGDLCEMARASGVAPIVRPYTRDTGVASRLLDIGAQGVMFPDVHSASEVALMAEASLYPPLGLRSSTSASTAQDYQSGPGTVAKAAVNDSVLVSAQIESREGVERLEEILAPGVIGLIEIGRGDLSTDLGCPLESRHPAVLAAVDRVVDMATARGVPVGTLSSTREDAEDMLARGLRSIVLPNEQSLLLDSYRRTFSSLRETVDSLK